MARTLARLLLCATLTVAAACSDAPASSAPAADGGSLLADGGSGQDGGVASACAALGLPALAFSTAASGTHRGDVAGDFTVPLVDGSSWQLSAQWLGCETYLFLPDGLRVAGATSPSLWESPADLADLAELVDRSPRNAHYFFVSTRANDADADTAARALQGRVDGLVATMDGADGEHWRTHLHVVSQRAARLGGWLTTMFSKAGALGFGIDRAQRLRSVGSLADVSRIDAQLQAMGVWPWKANLAYAAFEAASYEAAALREAALAADGATVVPLWRGEVVAGTAEVDAALPAAVALAAFDTLTVEVTLGCPDPEKVELGNCGAWDYLARLSLVEPVADGGVPDGGVPDGGVPDAGVSDGGAPPPAPATELARFITSYHRETRWVVDATPWLARLRAGGPRRFRLELAPPWNPQPTVTTVSLRLSARGKGYRPAQVVPLFAGGDFTSHYNDGRLPITVPIPASVKRVELWALITGHGSGTRQCAEFCNHQHEFAVNGTAFRQQFAVAGTTDGCMEEVARGLTPNQAGTWWFGRGGWCPGQQVEPWVVDVSAQARPGTSATITYRGLLGGQPPPDGAGNIELNSALVLYE